MTKRLLAAAVALVCAVPLPLGAWGFDGHRYIAERAIELLPDGLKPFYQKNRSFVAEHAIDPDLWRNAGFDEEPPRHFLDFDAYGAYPFTDLPREHGAATQKYGPETLAKNGVLPWRVEEMYGRLVRAFQQMRSGSSYAAGDVAYFSSVLSHYIGDSHQPFHAVVNYDGQLTGQQGLHARFEDELFRRYRAKLTIAPKPVGAVTKPRDFAFETLLASFTLVDPLLKADRDAIGSGEEYDDAYFDRFFQASRLTLETRLADSIAGVAAIWTGAWETAGKPDVLTERPRPVRKRVSSR